MVIVYWIVAGLLGLFYLYSGGIKVLQSREKLRPMLGWVDTVPLGFVRTIGVLEVRGAIGLILPPPTGIAARRQSGGSPTLAWGWSRQSRGPVWLLSFGGPTSFGPAE